MNENKNVQLGGVAETLLITLYVRATESMRPDAIIKDERSIEILHRLDYDFTRFEHIHMDEDDRVSLILRNREFDRCVRSFLDNNPEGVVVNLGCGLDTRFDRVDNGKVEWFDLDLPEVIDLRRRLIGEANPRCHLLPFSVFDPSWFDSLPIHPGRKILIIAEGVFMYFPKELVRTLFLSLRDRFPGSELVFDAFAPWLVGMNNLKFKFSRTKMAIHYYWGLGDGTDVEQWGGGITFISQWFLYDQPEPRLAHLRWMRRFRPLARVIGVYRYTLG
jgi:O-methyltransferase involved in polyketide biosynthesis